MFQRQNLIFSSMIKPFSNCNYVLELDLENE